MGAENVQVNPLTLAHLFEKNIRYLVPLYQRPYVWTEEDQWEPLWEDVARLADNLVLGRPPSRMHFLGASVQDKVDVPPGHVETRRLIDGQQRFTSLQVLFVAFRDALRALAIERFDDAVDQLITNRHALRYSDEEVFKVWPTNVDRGDFVAVMSCGSPEALRDRLEVKSKVGRAIPDAYLYFFETISDWLAKDPTQKVERAQALYGALHDNVRIVVIDLDQNDDAQVIFETLNARGTPLLAADLVKNSILNEIHTDRGDVEKAYDKHWKQFDEKGEYWRRLIGRGHARRARIEHFLQHTLTILKRDEVPAAHLYTAYQDFARSPLAGAPVDRLKAFQDYAEIYKRLEEKKGSPRFAMFLERLQAMDITSAMPLLMTVYKRLLRRPTDLDNIARDLESFLVRRLICRLSTRGYNQFFVDLTKASLDVDDAAISTTIRHNLNGGSAEFDRWPSDDEFRQAWLTNPLYENLTRSRLRMILEAVEGALRTDRAETNNVPKGLTIEHILPQSWEAHWPLPPDQDRAERKTKVHRIGNLTLVNGKLNPSMSNGPWQPLIDSGGRTISVGKRNELEKHTTLFLNKQLTARPQWSDQEITERGEKLFELARLEWPKLDPACSGIDGNVRTKKKCRRPQRLTAKAGRIAAVSSARQRDKSGERPSEAPRPQIYLAETRSRQRNRSQATPFPSARR
jgi:hypothetical protein